MSWSSAKAVVVDVVTVARNDARTLRAVLDKLPTRAVRSVVVVDNGSTDSTGQVARDAGAVVLREPRIGYGSACLRAVAHLEALPRHPDVVVFLPADDSADASEIGALLAPFRDDNAELVIGTRSGGRERPAPPTRLALALIRAIYRHRFADLGPFRAIRFPALVALGMADLGASWNVEMQVKAVKLGLHIVEVPISWRSGARQRETRARDVIDSVGTTGRMFFQILRNATAR